MDFDMPTDLINQSQIEFRERAGLSSFNPNDTTLPPPETIEASISSLDPSPPYLRCKYCQGKLLRGLQSLICVYCGEYQKKDLHPDPISFNSTNGFSWLLQSLNLNGSERVGSFAEGNGVPGRQSPAEAVVTLSELLDLQITWRDEPKKADSSLNNKDSEHITPSNLGTTNLDNFFTERFASGTTEEISSKQDQSKAFETSVPSSIDDASSDWNAEFQFADSKVEIENPKPVDPFVGAESEIKFETGTDLSAHMDAVFGQMEGVSSVKPNEEKDWVDDDLFANMGSSSFQLAEKLDLVVQVQPKDELSSGNINDLSSSKEWVDDDLFANMGPTTFHQAEMLDSVVQVEPKGEASSHVNDSSSSKDVEDDWFSDGNWQTSSGQKVDNSQSQDKPNNSPFTESVSVDWFDDGNWQKSSGDKKDDNSFEFKPQINELSEHQQISSEHKRSDIDSSKKQDVDTTDWFQDSQWSTGATNTVGSKDDDEFDDWNDFTSSTPNQDSWKQSSNEKTAGSEKIQEVNLFESTQEVEFDLFGGSSSNKKPDEAQTVFDNFPESSTATRNVNGEGENDVEMLMSQMHDLSFMLKSELSIPSKPQDGDFGSFNS